jgi:CDP-diacylglycerol--glycerol-3-phosphate 3-phosphatidyltransferase
VEDARTVSGPLSQLPNALTLARLFVIPAYAALILSAHAGRSWPAALIFGAAGVTDQIDGFLARRWHVESAFGKIADPLADRLLIDTAVLLLWHAGRLPWAALAIPARDLLLIGATPLVVGRGYRFEVNLLGKAATWLLYLSLGLVMVVHHGSWPLGIFWAGFGLALVSLLLYARKVRQETTAGQGNQTKSSS